MSCADDVASPVKCGEKDEFRGIVLKQAQPSSCRDVSSSFMGREGEDVKKWRVGPTEPGAAGRAAPGYMKMYTSGRLAAREKKETEMGDKE